MRHKGDNMSKTINFAWLVVKALTKAEFDALPKSLQKELKEFR